MKKIILFILVVCCFIVFLLDICFAKTTGTYFTTGFKMDDYGYYSYFYDEDKFYNDGWHLLDTNRDGVYEYYYFTISGHYLVNNIAPNGYQLNENGNLVILDTLGNSTIYQISFSDINTALFLNKTETNDEIKLAFKNDYTQVFNNWYLSAVADVGDKLLKASVDMSVNKANIIKNEISTHTKELKKILTWYNERLNLSKKNGTIDSTFYKELEHMATVDMSEINNKFREEMNDKIKALGY